MNETLLVLRHAGDPSRCVPPRGEAPSPTTLNRMSGRKLMDGNEIIFRKLFWFEMSVMNDMYVFTDWFQ